MSVEGLIQSIVLIFSDVQHSRAEVLGALCGFITKQLQKLTSRRVRNRIKGFHESTSRGCIDLEAQSLRTFNEVNLKLISECHEQMPSNRFMDLQDDVQEGYHGGAREFVPANGRRRVEQRISWSGA